MKDGRVLTFQVEVQSTAKATFALGVRKSGSSIFSSIVNALALNNNINVVDIPERMFNSGYRYIDWNDHQRVCDLLWRGNCYIGFRDPPTALYSDPVFIEARKILLVRDPRDALVSEYFSNAYSHSLPTEDGVQSVVAAEREKALRSTLTDYVLKRAADLDRTVERYRPILNDKNLLIMHYEDIIFNKGDWIKKIVAHFGWKYDEQHASDVLGWADQRPDAENPKAFVRKVTPGDYVDKLPQSTIDVLGAKLSDVWGELGYRLREQ
jgi:hypothetical protein